MMTQPTIVKYHQLDDLFRDGHDRTIIGKLRQGHLVTKEGDGYNVNLLRSEVERYKDRIVVVTELALQTSLNTGIVGQALLDAQRQGIVDDISRNSRKRVYALREGRSMDEVVGSIRSYGDRREAERGEVVHLGTLREELGISPGKWQQILYAGARDRYLIGGGMGGGGHYRIKPTTTKKDFVAELLLLKEAYSLKELAAVLGLPAHIVPKCMTPELEAEYLDVVVAPRKHRMWKVKPDKDLDDLAERLRETTKGTTLNIREATYQGRKVKRLMFLQSRYQGDTEYAAKIEALLLAYPQVDQERRRRAAEHQALDEIAALMYHHMPSPRREELVKELQREYDVVLSLQDEKGQRELTETPLKEDYFTHHQVSGLLGLHTFQAKVALFTLFKGGIITAVGGTPRIPQYTLKEGMSVEDIVEMVLQEYELVDTKRVLGTTNEGNGSNRVLFLKARYPRDKFYHAKVDLYLRGYASALLLQGWKGMQALEHQALDSGLRVMFSYLQPDTAEKIVKSVTADFGVDLTAQVQKYVGIHLHDPVDYVFEDDTSGKEDRSGRSSGARKRASTRKDGTKHTGQRSGKGETKKKASRTGVSRSAEKSSAPSSVKKTPLVPEAVQQSPAPLRGRAAWDALADDDDDDPADDLDWEDEEGD